MTTKDFSSKQEKMIADFLGWKVVSGSGARACHPGDIVGDDWLGECKTHTTRDNPIFFSSTVWEKIGHEAQFTHRNPVLFSDDGSQKIDKTWCMINQFAVPADWSLFYMNKRFKTNFKMKHEDLSKLYHVDNIINGIDAPICYTADLSSRVVVILPLRLFQYMFA